MLANFFQPGAGLSIPADGLVTAAKFAEGGKALSTVDFLLNIIPKTILDALSGGVMLQILLVFGTVARLTRFSLLKFMRHIKEEMLIAFTTTSSEAALPGLMKKLERAGCSQGIVGFVVPAGYSFNLDGSSIYMTIAALFIAQAAGVHLGWAEQASLLLVLLLTSKGVAGVTGGAFVTLAATLTMFPDIPLAGIALILGVDRMIDAMRTLTNVVGNGVATMAMAYWHGQRAELRLDGQVNEPASLEPAQETL